MMDKRPKYRWAPPPRPELPMRLVARVEHSEQLVGHDRKVFFGAVDAQLLDDLDWMWTRGQPLSLRKFRKPLCCGDSIPYGVERCDLCPALHQY